MFSLVLLAFVFGGSFADNGLVDYCDDSLSCDDGPTRPKKKHLLCKFKSQKALGGCTDIRGGMTPDERGRIVARHNIYRDVYVQDTYAYEDYHYPTLYPNGSIVYWNETEWAYRIHPFTTDSGLGFAQCMRQYAWDYGNEKMAQIYAEQCTTERYDCMVDYKEGFHQLMSIFTEEGIHNGKKLMDMVFERWLSNNKSMVDVPPGMFNQDKFYANGLDDYNYKDEKQSKFLDWANIMYWRSYLFGCGKAHFRENGKDWTRVVCIYGPGVNYIPVLKEMLAIQPLAELEPPGALYWYDFYNHPCHDGGTDPALHAACPNLKCECRRLHADPKLDLESSWPWLCANDCLRPIQREGPIPAYIGYLTGSAGRSTKSLIALLLGVLYF